MIRHLSILTAMFAFVGCFHAKDPAFSDRYPEMGTGKTVKAAVSGKHWMVSAAHPVASAIGRDVLRDGGSAVDALVAVQMALNLVEPQSSGIGGGMYALYWDQESKALTTVDGRETAPLAAQPDLFLEEDGTPMDFRKAFAGGRAVGTPGVIAALAMLHKRYGKLSWQRLLEPTIRLAREGFVVSERTHQLLTSGIHPLLHTADNPSQAYFFPNGKALMGGGKVVNPAFAKTLEVLVAKGPDAFYEGDLAQDMVDAVRTHPTNPGLLSVRDFKHYRALTREPVCLPYRAYKVCGMGPSSSGGIAVLQILGVLEAFPVGNWSILGTRFIHHFSQASRLAFADRAAYLGDPAFADVPVASLLNPLYLKKRATLISPERDMKKALPGHMGSKQPDVGKSPEQPSTTHIAIVDGEGNGVSVTSSIEMAFGSGVFVNGYLLNNQLTDFSFLPQKSGRNLANAVAGGKRPRSSMAPMMIFDRAGQLRYVIGSPGGSRIIDYVALSIVALIDWKLGMQEAINLPRVSHRNQQLELEEHTKLTSLVESLEAMGHEVNVRDLNSGLHGIHVSEDGLFGGADPRRDGVVLAD